MVAGSTISNQVTISVMLGSGSYLSPLTVTTAGAIDPTATDGATGLIATISAGIVLNQGSITGGVGTSVAANGFGGAGGIGVDLAFGSLTNAGRITGGTGGYNTSNTNNLGGSGGSGVVVASGSLTNDGTITGGRGVSYSSFGNGGSGGSGVDITGGSVTNHGMIAGGEGAIGSSSGGGDGASGSGVYLNGGSLANDGTIVGGGGASFGFSLGGQDGAGGSGAALYAGSVLTNTGGIAGGAGGASGLTGFGGSGGAGAVVVSSSLRNSGTIAGGSGGNAGGFNLSGGHGGSGGDGVDVTGGSLTNTGTIGGGDGGSGGYSGAGGAGGAGVSLTAGSVLTNTGGITGGAGNGYLGSSPTYYVPPGSFAAGGSGVDATDIILANDGTIAGGAGGHGGTGVDITLGTLTNSGRIAGGVGFARYYGSGADLTGSRLVNNGTITGGYAGVAVFSGGLVTNAASATITGRYGVSISGSGTVVNAGTIIAGDIVAGKSAAGRAAVRFGGAGADRLVVDPGAVFIGNVIARGSPATLELGSAAGAGTIAGIGTSFAGFGTITVDPQATWAMTGSVSGTGTIDLGAGSDLTIGGGAAATAPVHFTANTGELRLGDPADFAATLSGFQMGDAIDFTSITSAGSITAGVDGFSDLTLTSDGLLLAEIKLDPAQDFAGDRFQTAADNGNGHGTVVTDIGTPLCFLAGTLIATPAGETPVERLRVGGMIVTASGVARPIVWIGTGRVLATPGRRTAATPVVVRKGAFGGNVPHHDLLVTKAHAFLFDDVLIPVEFLINHRSILWDDMAREVELYHIELESHDVLLANGAPAESYRDDGNRWLFRNANSGWHLPPQQPSVRVLTAGDPVDAVWRRLLDRAGPRPGLPLTDDPDLHLRVHGRRIDAAPDTGDFHVFGLPRTPETVRIASRAAAPQELGLSRDPRSLGVALRRIIIRQGARARVIEADDARLTDGFYAFEDANAFRWTDGDAVLPAPLFAGFKGPLEVVLQCGVATNYINASSKRFAT